MQVQEVLKIGLPIVLSAMVAGIGALIKTAAERRDARRSAHRQLELATVRTQFVKEWLEVSRSLDGDAAYMEAATDKALVELDEAYADAQLALADGKSALEGSITSGVVRQLRRFVMLVPRTRAASYAVIVALYFAVTLMWIGAFAPPEPGDPEPLTRSESVAIAAGFTIFLRIAAGAWVAALERRSRKGDVPATEGDSQLPLPTAVA